MKPLSDYVAYIIHDCMQEVSGVSARFMFGGWGLYKDGLMFGLVADDRLYFKVGESNKDDYVSRGCGPFVYSQGNHKPTTMSYYEVPDEVIENKEEIVVWVAKAVEVQKQAKKPKKAKS